MLAILLTVTLQAPVELRSAQTGKQKAPEKLELFAKESWYKSQKGDEKEFVGFLQRIDRGKGVVGFGRFNPYRLTEDEHGKKTIREVYVGGKLEILEPYVGKKIKLVGKAVDMNVEGREHREIWPARLEIAGGKKTDPTNAKELKVHATGPWPYVSANPNGSREGRQLVIRSGKELAETIGSYFEAPAKAVEKLATEAVAKALKVDAIDWSKQMIVVVTAGVKPTGGYRVEFTKVSRDDKSVTVQWQLHTPKGAVTQAFTHPAQVALIERVDSEVRFEPSAAKLRSDGK